jgi:hypothetical protein
MNDLDGASTRRSAVRGSPLQYATFVNSEIVQLIRKSVQNDAKRAEFVPRDDRAMTPAEQMALSAPKDGQIRVVFDFEMTLR